MLENKMANQAIQRIRYAHRRFFSQPCTQPEGPTMSRIETPELKLFISSRDSTCDECHDNLGTKA
jgi:hypothetical protein